jgi:hypothetical protein
MPDKAIDVLDEACARSRVREHGGHGDGEAAAPGAAQTVITPESVMEVISLMSGIPLTKLTITETDRLLGLADKLRERVVGQVRRPTTLAPHNGRPRRHAVLHHAAPPRLASPRVLYARSGSSAVWACNITYAALHMRMVPYTMCRGVVWMMCVV